MRPGFELSDEFEPEIWQPAPSSFITCQHFPSPRDGARRFKPTSSYTFHVAPAPITSPRAQRLWEKLKTVRLADGRTVSLPSAATPPRRPGLTGGARPCADAASLCLRPQYRVSLLARHRTNAQFTSTHPSVSSEPPDPTQVLLPARAPGQPPPSQPNRARASGGNAQLSASRVQLFQALLPPPLRLAGAGPDQARLVRPRRCGAPARPRGVRGRLCRPYAPCRLT